MSSTIGDTNEEENPDLIFPDDNPAPAFLYTQSEAGLHFVNNDRSLKVLIAMCHGLNGTDGKKILDLSEEPWKSIKPAANIKLSLVASGLFLQRTKSSSLAPRDSFSARALSLCVVCCVKPKRTHRSSYMHGESM